MTVNDILKSGLLELYALSMPSAEDKSIVEEALPQSSELRAELSAIESALQKFAMLLSVPPSPELKEKLLSKIKASKPDKMTKAKATTESNGTSLLQWLLLVSCLGLMGAYFVSHKSNSALQEKYDNKVILCDSITQAQEAKIIILENIQNKNNRIIELKATEKYPATEAYFHYNTELKKNYIQIQNLPDLASNQSFQLWALKGDNAPVPLDVFEADKDNIFEVEFVNNPDAYAITIEPLGGQDAPTLANLIGVIAIAG